MLARVDTRKNETYQDVAAGFGVGLATARGYTQETVGLLAAQASTLNDALERVENDPVLLIGGTLTRRDRVALPEYYAGQT